MGVAMGVFRLILAGLVVLSAGPVLAQDAARLAKLHVVSSGPDSVTRQFFGQVVAKETVDLAFQVGGQIIELPVIEGEPVPSGGLVAGLDREPFELALRQAKVQKDQADRTLERMESLQGSSAVSRVTVDDARTQAELAAISLRNAERSLEDAELHAPFDALVASRNVANFTTIAAGTPIVRLHDMSELRIEIDVPEVLFLNAGEDPDVSLLAKFPSGDTMYPLGVREFNAETSQVGQTFRITLGMPPPEGLTVLPGASVTVFASIRSEETPIEIPASALIFASDGAAQVMVFEPAGAAEGTVRLQPVEVTPSMTGKVQVTGGLTQGQEIVASGASQLSDGDAVRRFMGFSN